MDHFEALIPFSSPATTLMPGLAELHLYPRTHSPLYLIRIGTQSITARLLVPSIYFYLNPLMTLGINLSDSEKYVFDVNICFSIFLMPPPSAPTHMPREPNRHCEWQRNPEHRNCHQSRSFSLYISHRLPPLSVRVEIQVNQHSQPLKCSTPMLLWIESAY